ncbi:MAG: DMT family transporter [Candidatus Puniceispirillaceae bacterium]|jgi:transporter family-2 protein
MVNIKYLIWALLAGAFIPLIGILNGRVGRALGEPFYASVMLFGVAIILAFVVSVIFGKAAPSVQNLQTLRPMDYTAGFIVAFYVISATVLAGKIGVANFIVMAVSGQIMFSLMIDHFGLFGAPVKPINMTQLVGAVLLLIGLATTQLASSKLD